MASFQILDLPFEENLSDEQAMSIDAGITFVDRVLDFAEDLVQQGLLTADQATDLAYQYLLDVGAACQGSDDLDACLASYGVV
ncbi:MAG: hypothetical protein AB4372_26430 [Xenococcus sp. (in: cyanobacteria)]